MYYPILLTATISVIDHHFVAIKDKSIREEQYYYAIQFYLEKGFKVVFVDNSNTISDRIIEKFSENKNFEYLTFLSEKSDLGKGHGEKEIIDFALNNSKTLRQSDFFVKVTGRLKVLNICEILEKIEWRDNVTYGNLSRLFSWSDTRLMLLSKQYYLKYLSPCLDKYLEESNGVFFENVSARSIHLFLSEGGRFRFYPTYPIISGFNGSNGKKYDFSIFKRLKYFLFFKFKFWFNNQTV